jgi:GT2 family glycosyltransferase
MPFLSIITVNYNQAQATIDLLTSIQLHGSHLPMEIILVDNGSIDNKELDYKACCKDIKFIRSEKNIGFAAGNNLGIKQASGKYLFLVNNDTIFTAGLVETLLQTMEANPMVGILSPMIKYDQDRDVIQYAGFTPMNYYTCRNECIGQFEKDLGQYKGRIGQTGYCHGAAMMISRRALDKAGFMEENFFLYYEEMDWCEKIKRAGFQVWVNAEALIYHKESLAVGKNSALKEYFMNRNRILFTRRNASFFTGLIFYGYFLLLVTPRNIINYMKDRHPGYTKLLFRAIGWNLRHSVNSKHLGYQLTT